MKKEKMDDCWSILTEELTMEILVRLPIKSLMQLKCLNKTWRKFISSSDFTILHFDRNKNKAVSHLCRTREDIHSLFNHKATNLRIPSCMGPSLFQVFMPSIVGSSSNGLVCLRERQNWSRFVVWNPATRECRYLPNPENKKARPQPIGYCAGFDFRPDGVCDYKLVLVKFYHGSQNLELILRVKVFTRSTNSWKQIKDGLVPRMGYSTAIKDGLVPLDGALHSDGVSLNGSMYWSEINETFGRGIDRSPLEPQFVACFDIWKEKFMQINGPGPCCAENYRCMKALGVVKGTLAMFIGSGDSSRCFEGWVMNGQDHSWTKFFTVGPLPPICPQNYVKVLGFWLNGEIIVYDVRGLEIFLYDPHTKERMDFPVDNYTDYNLFQYKETLFSV